MGKKQKGKITGQQELGVALAETLLKELVVPPNVKFSKRKKVLLERTPSECKFFSYQENKKTIEPTKEALLQDMLNNKDSTVAFCCVSLTTETRLTFDIDHVFPRERIAEKQNVLLRYLNNPNTVEVTKAFMGEVPKKSGRQHLMQQ